MLKINVKKNKNSQMKLLTPSDMLKAENSNRIFAMFDLNRYDFVNTFFINCGVNEKSVITIWYDDEDKQYRLSTDNLAGLKEYNKHIKVVDVTDTINLSINLEI